MPSVPSATVHCGDVLDVMGTLDDGSVDAIITDPPYGLSSVVDPVDVITRWAAGERGYIPEGRGIVNQGWDAFVPPPALWDECLRVLRPGGLLLAFAGSRTHDLMGLSIRFAGFEIRDTLMWAYASGMSKSVDVSVMIDKGNGSHRSRAEEFTAWMRSTGITARQINDATGSVMGAHLTTHPTQPRIASPEMFDAIRHLLPRVPERIERIVAERTGSSYTDFAQRQPTQSHHSGYAGGTGRHAGTAGVYGFSGDYTSSEPHSAEARQWEGWGTSLRPALEPIIVARKPLTGTVAESVLTHGTGAMHLKAVRRANGRRATNVLMDESLATGEPGACSEMNDVRRLSTFASVIPIDDAAFFVVSKPSSAERPMVHGVQHPTTKPLALMRWLVRLSTPPEGTVLDPFAGSGTTLEAAVLEGFDVVGIEREQTYIPLIDLRIERARGAAPY